MGLSPCHSVCQSIHQMGGTQEDNASGLRKKKTQFAIQGLLSLGGGKWACTFLSLRLPGALCHQLCWDSGILARVNVLPENAWPSLLHSPPTYHSESFQIAFLFWESKVSLSKMRNKQPTGWSLKHPWSGMSPRRKKQRKGTAWVIFLGDLTKYLQRAS